MILNELWVKILILNGLWVRNSDSKAVAGKTVLILKGLRVKILILKENRVQRPVVRGGPRDKQTPAVDLLFQYSRSDLANTPFILSCKWLAMMQI